MTEKALDGDKHQQNVVKKTNKGGRPKKAKKSLWADTPELTEREVAEWVLESWFLEDLNPQDAPSAKAWGYVLACRSNNRILEGLYNVVLAKQINQIEEKEWEEKYDRGRRSCDIDGLLQDVVSGKAS